MLAGPCGRGPIRIVRRLRRRAKSAAPTAIRQRQLSSLYKLISVPNQFGVTTAGAPAEVAGKLRVALMRMVRRLKRETDGEHSVSVIAALGSVSSRGPLTLGELAEAEGVSRPSMTVLAASLLDQGLVARESDPSDGRLVRVHITQAGKRVLEGSRTRRNAYLARRLGALDSDELGILDSAATILLRLVEKEP